MTDVSRAELKYLVERQREEMKALNEIGKVLNSTMDPQEVIRLVAAYLHRTLPLALCAILVIEQRKLRLIRYTGVGQMALAVVRKELVAKANSLLARPLMAEELAEVSEDLPGGAWGQTQLDALPSSHCVPLKFNQEIIGLLSVYSGKEKAFTDEDRHAIDIVADHMGAALRNAVLLDALQRAGQLKNDLLMLISHELHTPLTSIKEGTNLILDDSLGPTTPDQREFLKTVHESAGRLETLIEKVLIATQLLTGQLPFTAEPVRLPEVLRQIESDYRPLATAKRVTLEFAGLGQPGDLRGDGKRLRLAISQIVENALQATTGGGLVTVTMTPTGDGIDVQIADTGPGIPAKDIPSIFESFRFLGGVDDRKTGGLGLGFFIAKGIVERHHGTIRLESEVGHGTRVLLHLPKSPPSSTKP